MPSFDADTAQTEARPIDLPKKDVLAVFVLAGPDTGRNFRLPDEGGVIGRAAEAEVRIDDPYVSRRHAVVEPGPGGALLIRDSGSKYGTWLEGRRISEAKVFDGDRIQISRDTVLRIRVQDATEAAILSEMQMAAMTDPLTHLANRRYLMDRLAQEWSFARRHETSLTLLILDIDRFKQINDELGHGAGDAALKTAADTLRAAVRKEDVISRFGGDELVVISRGYPASSGVRFAERLRRAVRLFPVDLGSQRFRISVSIGVSSFDPRAERVPGSVEELFARADAALYHSKTRGRDCVTEWSEIDAPGARIVPTPRGETLDLKIPNQDTEV